MGSAQRVPPTSWILPTATIGEDPMPPLPPTYFPSLGARRRHYRRRSSVPRIRTRRRRLFRPTTVSPSLSIDWRDQRHEWISGQESFFFVSPGCDPNGEESICDDFRFRLRVSRAVHSFHTLLLSAYRYLIPDIPLQQYTWSIYMK